MKIKILDCTIRDGGYYNNWRFSDHFVEKYLNTLQKCKIDYVEIGYRKNIKDKNFGKFINVTDQLSKKLKKKRNLSFSIMIDLADIVKQNLNIDRHFSNPKKSGIDLIRIASSYEDLKHLKQTIIKLKKKKYKVSVNLMKFTILTKNQILNFFNECRKYKIDFYYIADSFGNCTPGLINNISKYLRQKKFSLNKFGFHGHDNLGLGNENAMTALKNGFKIIDTSIMGMGRGAGNVKLEEFIYNLDKKNQDKMFYIQKFIEEVMMKMKQKYNWGTNFSYFYAAKNFIHPTFVQRLLTEKKFNFYNLIEILSFLSKSKSSKYDANIFDNFFLEVTKFKEKKTKFRNKKVNIFTNNCKNIDYIANLSDKKKYLTASLNLNEKFKNFPFDYIFVSNPYRFFTEINSIKKSKKKIVIPNFKNFQKNIKSNTNIIKYNFNYANNKFKIDKLECSYKLNLVIFYAISFFITNNFNEINIYGFSKNKQNKKIEIFFSNFISKNNLKTKLAFHS